MFTESSVKIKLLFIIFVFSSFASAKNTDLLQGLWLDTTQQDSYCPIAVYSYKSNGEMNAATILCSKEGVIAVNYKTKWVIDNGVLSHTLVKADPPFMEILSEQFKQTNYSIISLNDNQLKIKDIKTKQVFIYTKM